MNDHVRTLSAMNELMPMWSDELLGKLLAFSAATGFPPCTMQEPMTTVLQIAAKRFGVEGGTKPNKELMDEHYLPRLKEIKQQKTKTSWLPELMKRYHVKNWRVLDYSWAEDIPTP
jgi:hypothetical protein